MTEYSRMAKGFFTSTGFAQAINLPFQPDYVEFINRTAFARADQFDVPQAWWDVNNGQGTAWMNEFLAGDALTTDIVQTNGISTFSAGLALQFGPQQQIVTSTKASPTSFNVVAHGYQTGDVVMFQGLYQTAVTGMPQMSGQMFSVTRTDADNFTVLWNSTGANYTALAGSPAGAFVKKVLYPYLYFPGVNFVSALVLAATTTVTTTAQHNYYVGQEIAFRIAPEWGTSQLNSLPNVVIPGSPIYGYVVSITNAFTFVCNIDSTNFTAFNVNQPIEAAPGFPGVSGIDLPQVLAVGDVNTGGASISPGSALYPPPYTGEGGTHVNTINGPAIKGAFVNNTSQGFIIGAGLGAAHAEAHLVGTAGDVIFWRAYLHDISLPS